MHLFSSELITAAELNRTDTREPMPCDLGALCALPQLNSSFATYEENDLMQITGPVLTQELQHKMGKLQVSLVDSTNNTQEQR